MLPAGPGNALWQRVHHGAELESLEYWGQYDIAGQALAHLYWAMRQCRLGFTSSSAVGSAQENVDVRLRSPVR